MLAREEFLLIIYFIIVILMLTIFGIVFFITFQRRKNKLLYEKFEAEKRYEQEIAQSRIEIQEQTLKNVGWELHDNIGQLLSVANMQLNILSRSVDEPVKPSVIDIKEVVNNSLQEVRALSKSLNNEVVEYAGLEASVKNELDRFDRLQVIQTSFRSTGEKIEILPKDTIIIFRILQEFFSNVIKHSKAGLLEVDFTYTPDNLIITAKENGVGFDVNKVEKSSGIINMQSRAGLINSNFSLNSSPGKGTSVSLCYPTNKKQYEQNGSYR